MSLEQISPILLTLLLIVVCRIPLGLLFRSHLASKSPPMGMALSDFEIKPGFTQRFSRWMVRITSEQHSESRSGVNAPGVRKLIVKARNARREA